MASLGQCIPQSLSNNFPRVHTEAQPKSHFQFESDQLQNPHKIPFEDVRNSAKSFLI